MTKYAIVDTTRNVVISTVESAVPLPAREGYIVVANDNATTGWVYDCVTGALTAPVATVAETIDRLYNEDWPASFSSGNLTLSFAEVIGNSAHFISAAREHPDEIRYLRRTDGSCTSGSNADWLFVLKKYTDFISEKARCVAEALSSSTENTEKAIALWKAAAANPGLHIAL